VRCTQAKLRANSDSRYSGEENGAVVALWEAIVVEDLMSRKWFGAGDGGGRGSAQGVTMLLRGLRMASFLGRR
jgi:hypothetical protein